MRPVPTPRDYRPEEGPHKNLPFLEVPVLEMLPDNGEDEDRRPTEGNEKSRERDPAWSQKG